MAATELNLTVEQGTLFEHDVTIYSDSAQTTPLDLTPYSARAQVRSAKSSTSELQFSFVAEVLSPATDGVVRISVLPATTADLTDFPLQNRWDLEIHSGVDEVYRVHEGILTISPEVTS